VLAILSFDQREHILKQAGIVNNIENKITSMARNGWFDSETVKLLASKNQKRHRRSILADKKGATATKYSIPDWSSNELKEEKKDFILALSIILSNLWRDENYSSKLLRDSYESEALSNMPHITNFLPKFLNLLEYDPENPYISEQLSILLANLSNSDSFNCTIVSDKCICSMMDIISLKENIKPTQISILAVLITLLKLSMNAETCYALQKFKIMKYLLKIIKMSKADIRLEPNSKYEPERIMRVTKSIALLIVSNIITLRDVPSIDQAYIDFATDILTNIKEYSANEEIIIANNLLYSALILFYNLIESKKSVEFVKVLSELLKNILDTTHKQIIDITLELITLFTRYQDSCFYVLTNKDLIRFWFDKLTSKDPETLELCTLALSRISAELLNWSERISKSIHFILIL
jgi:hypothetical protein